MTIRSELEALIDVNGLLHPPTIVEWARRHPDSDLYREFEWDDAKAAQAHRLDQARRLIAVHIVDLDGFRTTFSLVSDRRAGNGYREIDEVTTTAAMRQEAIAMALREQQAWAKRFWHLRDAAELAAFFRLIDRLSNGRRARQDRRSA